MPLAATIWTMADWRQIQARIRKAKAGGDAAAKLAELYERTRDAMVAFELARWQEKAGEHAEAARWYTAAAERFRRSQWKTKAEAALARLRNPSSAPPIDADAETKAEEGSSSDGSEVNEKPFAQDDAHLESHSSDEPSHATEQQHQGDHETNQFEPAIESKESELQMTAGSGPASKPAPSDAAADQAIRKRPRRRGRRGGRNRRGAPRAGSDSPNTNLKSTVSSGHIDAPSEAPTRTSPPPAPPSNEPTSPVEQPPYIGERSNAALRGRGRPGEPALASRMAHLESQLRRLLASPQAKLEQAESAPAGPGVLLLSDSEQVTHYYVESCQTLRIAIGNLIRGGRGGKDLPQLKQRLAENLGIAETRVTNYLKEHCAVRWLQLDQGASELAHFAIAVLRPAVND